MSKCITLEGGEWSDHLPGDPDDDGGEFVCARCFVFDEDAVLARLAEKDARIAQLEAQLQENPDYWPLPDATERTGETDSHDDPGEVSPPSDAVRDCPFCVRIRKREYAETGDPEVVTFEPLNPVTPGHRLVVPTEHVEDAAVDSRVTGITFAAAAAYADTQGEPFNLITSAGSAATQTVDHLHVHYVPRQADDGLPLPWTNQVLRDLATPADADSSRPSPGADPRVEPVLTAIGAETELPYMARAANYVHAETTGEQRGREIAALQAADAEAERLNDEFAARVIAAADAADWAVGVVRVDTRDEALKQAVYGWITDGYDDNDARLRHDIGTVFAALAALVGEQ